MDVMQQRQRAVELREVAETTVILEFDALRVVTASIYESILSIRRDEMASMEVRNRPLTPLQTQVLVNAMSFGLFDQIGRIDVRRLSAILGTEPTALRRTLIDAETRIAARFLQELEKSQS
jgi:predicted DNA binding protein